MKKKDETYDPSVYIPCLGDLPPRDEMDNEPERGGDDESHQAGRRPWRGGLLPQNCGEGEI